MASHVWSKGLMTITDGNTAGSPAFASWRAIAVSPYAGYWKCELATAMGTYTSDQMATANTETSGAGYSTKGVAMSTVAATENSVSLDSTGAYVEYVCTTAPQWTASSFSAAYAAVVASTGTGRTECPAFHLSCCLWSVWRKAMPAQECCRGFPI